MNDLLKKDLERSIKRTKAELLDAISILEGRLQKAREDLNKEEDGLPNILGIIQGLGTEIDRLVGELKSLVKIKSYWK